MKFEECKIYDVVDITNDTMLQQCCNGETRQIKIPNVHFIIEKIHPISKTVKIVPIDIEIIRPFDFVLPSCLELRGRLKTTEVALARNNFSMSEALHGKIITRPQTSDYKLDFEVRREENELSAYYHGVKLATVRCHPDDAYDEEFGLHLLLRRACLKLKDEHTVVETVEELL